MAVPAYDRRALTPAVVHLSVGSFHRSHQAVYLDRLAALGHRGWGVTGVGLRRRAMGEALAPQDHLWTVVERGPGGDRPQVVGVMGDYVFAPGDPDGVVARLADPRTRLVTLTVTRTGYDVDRAEAAGPGPPRSALGLMTAALDRRRRTGARPFTVLSCDNLTASGLVTRDALVRYAAHVDPALARWIDRHGAFPSTMVDRITPETTDADRDRLAREFGVMDRWPVITEPFADWVVEDAFADERPPLEDAGVRVVRDVGPYAVAKTRLLNASHVALAALGRLAGHRTMPEVMRDPVLADFVSSLMADEIAPGLPAVAQDLDRYRASLLERLANPHIGDQLARLCRGASLKVTQHVLPSLRAARRDGRPHPLLTLAVAAVCADARGVDDRGRPVAIDDPGADRLRALGVVDGSHPARLRSAADVLGDLARDEELVADLATALRALWCDGARATVGRALAAERPVAA